MKCFGRLERNPIVSELDLKEVRKVASDFVARDPALDFLAS
jgi:hypothetical protein